MTIKCLFLFLFSVTLLPYKIFSQKKENYLQIAISGGPFIVGKDYGVWLSTSIEKKFSDANKSLSNNLTVEGELYFENATDKVTVYNPAPQQFISDRFYHESNSGLVIRLNYYPFNNIKIIKGLHLGAGPLLVYSLRTFERRAELIQYSPTLSIRMSEMTSDKKLLAGYRVTAEYDIYFSKNCLAGIRADFLQYHDRDLNSLLGLKVGYRF